MLVKHFVFLLGLFFAQAVIACDFEIVQSAVPFAVTDSSPKCLDNYFQKRDIGTYSLSRGPQMTPTTELFKDNSEVFFYDQIVFTSGAKKVPADDVNRGFFINQMLQSFIANLRSSNGHCDLKLLDSQQKELTLNDFEIIHRELEGQPGTRLMLLSDKLGNSTHWELLCPVAKNEKAIKKLGSYFMIMIDIHDNVGVTKDGKTLNYGQLLFSLM